MANPNAKGNPRWVKGVSGNPKGRPAAGEQFGDILQTYMAKKAKKEGYEHWIQRVVEMAWDDRVMMGAVLKKLIPDKVQNEVSGKIEVCWIGEDSNSIQTP